MLEFLKNEFLGGFIVDEDTSRGYWLISLVLLSTSLSVLAVMKMMLMILEPMDYRLDMTSKKYCKSLAEIDNSLRFQRGSEGEFHGVSPNGLPHTDDYSVSQELSEQQLINGNNNSHHFQSLNRVTQQTGSTNHVYPNGWIPVLESYKVKPGQVKKVIIFGRDLIVTRSVNSREVNVLDAYCPHMGVHIGIGGQVKEVNDESCIQCPFHGWLFRSSDGKCVKIPYQKHQNINNSSSKCIIPKQAKLDVWLSIEVDNFIYVWHHIDNQPPDWHLVPSDLLKAENRWTLIGRSFHKTNLELRDVLENGADMNHFEGIHNDLFLFGSNLINLRLNLNYLQKYTRHHWQPEWKPILNEHGKPTHKAEMKLQSWISFFKFRLFDITVKAIQNGPARVDLYYNSKWYGKGLLIMNAIPCGGRRTKYIQHIYTERSLFQCLMAKNVLFGEIKMLERDFFIWNHKKNIRSPIFVPEDKTLKQFRLWYSQFYKRKRKITIHTDECAERTAKLLSITDNNNTCKGSLVDF